MDSQSPQKLPLTWEYTTIGEVTLPYETIQPKKFPDSEFKYIDIGSIDNSNQTITNPKIFLGRNAPSRARRVVKQGDVVFSTVRTYLKNIACVPAELDNVLTSTGIAVLRTTSEITNNFLFYYVSCDGFIRKISGEMDGTLYPAVTDNDVYAAPIPLPPLNEQKRIVAKIKALQTRSTAVKEELEAIKPLLDQFRQSVLAAAFRGDLTKDWREQNPDVEPAEVLLERIRIEHRRRWEEAELEKMKAKGKVPKDDKWKKKYKEPEPIDTEGLPELPDGWCWETVSVLVTGGIQNGLYLPQSAYGSGIPILRIDNFQDSWSCSSSELQLVDASDKEISLYSLQVGDVVINRVNSPTHLGKSLLVEERNLPALFESNMMRLRVSNNCDLKFFNLYLQSPQGRRKLLTNAKWAVNQASINQTDVKDTLISIPPLEEQQEIVRRIESLFKLADSIEQEYQQAEADLETLNQSILAKAFRGELVPQDPNDEPASVLLERIREERDRAKAAAKKSKSKKKLSSKKQNQQLDIPGM